MGYRYTVIGAGRQGIAAAYDLALHGAAERIVLADLSAEAAERGAERLNALVTRPVATPATLNASDHRAVGEVLRSSHGLLSAVPFSYNETLTQLAIQTRTHMVDLGGHTGVVRSQLAWDNNAGEAGVSVVPDCGMGPGMNVSLALAAMERLDEPHEVRIYDGGLPQQPRAPWGYALLFHVDGLINEYEGQAYFLREGRVSEVPALSELEELDLPPLGRLEAFVTSGGLSTMPWTFAGCLHTLENKTLRYPGHCCAFRALRDAGLFTPDPIDADGALVAPRAVLRSLLLKRLTEVSVHDVCLIHARARGTKGGQAVEVRLQLLDYYDTSTGFLAMEKLTGWHAAMVLALAVRGEIHAGCVPVESALSGSQLLELAPARGWRVESDIVPAEPH